MTGIDESDRLCNFVIEIVAVGRAYISRNVSSIITGICHVTLNRPSVYIITRGRGVNHRFCNLEVPGSTPADDSFFSKSLFFHGNTRISTFFRQNPSVDFNIFFTTVRHIIVPLNKTLKRDFLLNVFLQINLFLKNAVSLILNKFI